MCTIGDMTITCTSSKKLRPSHSRPRISSALSRSLQVSPSPHLLGSRRRLSCAACAERLGSPKIATPQFPIEHSPRLKSSPPLSSYYASVPPKIALLRSVLPSESSKLLQVGKCEAYMSLCPPFIARRFKNMHLNDEDTSSSDSTTTSEVNIHAFKTTLTSLNTTHYDCESSININSNCSTVDDKITIEQSFADERGESPRKKNVLYTVAPQCESFQYLDLSHIPMKYSKTVQQGNDSMILKLTVSSVS